MVFTLSGYGENISGLENFPSAPTLITGQTVLTGTSVGSKQRSKCPRWSATLVPVAVTSTLGASTTTGTWREGVILHTNAWIAKVPSYGYSNATVL